MESRPGIHKDLVDRLEKWADTKVSNGKCGCRNPMQGNSLWGSHVLGCVSRGYQQVKGNNDSPLSGTCGTTFGICGQFCAPKHKKDFEILKQRVTKKYRGYI